MEDPEEKQPHPQNLKYLYSLLLEENFELRQQVESLEQAKIALETELTRSELEKLTLETRVLKSEVDGLVSDLEKKRERSSRVFRERDLNGLLRVKVLELKKSRGELLERVKEIQLKIDALEGETREKQRRSEKVKGSVEDLARMRNEHEKVAEAKRKSFWTATILATIFAIIFATIFATLATILLQHLLHTLLEHMGKGKGDIGSASQEF